MQGREGKEELDDELAVLTISSINVFRVRLFTSCTISHINPRFQCEPNFPVNDCV